MFKKILIGLVILIGIFLVVVALQPAEFRVERSALVAAPPETTFAQVNEFRNWPSWSPWAKMDPSMQTTFSTVSAGTGATYAWKGNNKVGEGSMTITESRPAEYIAIDLAFLKPFKATNLTEFIFKPIHGGTRVTWVMSGKNNFISKAVCMFMNMDKMVGGDFEKGLAGIKMNAEIASGWRKPQTANPAP